MRYSGIGGQAVMEGVMMKNKNRYAVAVRKPDHEIEVMTKEYKGIVPGEIWQKIPLVRGVLSFIDSLVLGMSTLMYSASFFEDEDESEKVKRKGQPGENEGKRKCNDGRNGDTVCDSGHCDFYDFAILPVGILFPIYCERYDCRGVGRHPASGNFYRIYSSSYLKNGRDNQRVFMYHGAEHKMH